MKLTVLGKYGPYPAAGGACSGYLVENGGDAVLLDCGNGVLSRLQHYRGLDTLNAILLSHLHSDHISDMFILRYAAEIRINRGQWQRGNVRVFCPNGPADEFGRLASVPCFAVSAIQDGMEQSFGSIRVRFCRMTHPVMSFAFDISASGRRLFYTGDTNWNENIVPVASGADVMLCDAGLLNADGGLGKPHLSAGQVGQVARDAGVGRLILTHIWPLYDEAAVVAEAREHFPGAVMAKEMESFEI